MPLRFKLAAPGRGGKQSRAVLLSEVTASRLLSVEEGGLVRQLLADLQAVEVTAVALSEDGRARSEPPWREVTPGRRHCVMQRSSAATVFTSFYLYGTPAMPAKEQQASEAPK